MHLEEHSQLRCSNTIPNQSSMIMHLVCCKEWLNKFELHSHYCSSSYSYSGCENLLTEHFKNYTETNRYLFQISTVTVEKCWRRAHVLEFTSPTYRSKLLEKCHKKDELMDRYHIRLLFENKSDSAFNFS